MVEAEATTAGAGKNNEFFGGTLQFAKGVPEWLRQVVLDPQTSGGLAVFSREPVEGSIKIGRAVSGKPGISVS